MRFQRTASTTHPNKRMQRYSGPAELLAVSAQACRTSKHSNYTRRRSWGPSSSDAIPAYQTNAKGGIRLQTTDEKKWVYRERRAIYRCGQGMPQQPERYF